MPRRKCHVAWRSDDHTQIGVKFEAPPAAPKGKGASQVKAMIAARQASLQPDMTASEETPIPGDKPADSGAKEPA